MLKSFFESFLDLIYKQECCVCGCSKTNEILCKNCAKTVHNLSGYAQRKIEDVCIFSAFKYEETIKKIIRNFKFNRRKSAAIPCAALLFEYYKKVCKQNDFHFDNLNAILVCVPSHPLRTMKRGYCHNEILTKEFSKLCNIDYDFSLIKKVKNTVPQYKVRANQKAKNIKDAFKIFPKNINNKTIILIDDVITTGSTLYEVIVNLKKYSYNKIIVLTLAC